MAIGSRTGIVIDSGASSTTITPVLEGVAVKDKAKLFPLHGWAKDAAGLLDIHLNDALKSPDLLAAWKKSDLPVTWKNKKIKSKDFFKKNCNIAEETLR